MAAAYETRAFVYLDIVSWLGSKIQGVPVQEVLGGGMVELSCEGAYEPCATNWASCFARW